MTMRFLATSLVLLSLTTPLLGQDDARPARGLARLSPDARIQLGEVSPAVVAIQESNPTTAEALIHATIDLLRLDQLELAQGYAKKFSELELDDKALADVGEAVGSAPLLRIIRTREIDEPAKRRCRDILGAVRRRKTDPARLAKLAQSVTQGDAIARRNAIIGLHSAGPASVEPLVRILADRSQANVHAPIRSALSQLGRQAVAPLLAVLVTRDLALQADVLQVLRSLDAKASLDDALALSQSQDPAVRAAATDVVLRLLGEVPDHAAVAKHTARTILDLLSGRRSIPVDGNGLAEKWRWDDAKKKLTLHRIAPGSSAAVAATQLATQLQLMRPNDPWANRLELLANLQWAKLDEGLDRPIDARTQKAILTSNARSIVDLLDEVLALATEKSFVPAAIGAAELLGASAALPEGGSHILTRGAPNRCPLVRALAHPDRRLRHAATQAIVALGLDRPFAGSSAVIESLRHFAGTTGQRRVLVIDPRPSRAQQLSGRLMERGFTVNTFYTGAAGLLAAARHPDVEMALIASTIEHPRAGEVVMQLRKDPRTAQLPIGIVASDRHLRMAEQRFADDPLIRVFAVPHDAATMQLRIDQLTEAAGAGFVPHDERLRQTDEALVAIGMVAHDHASMFDGTGIVRALEPALYHPKLSQAASKVLGDFGTPAAQCALVDLASANAMPVTDRSAAVKAFARNVREHGIGLTKRQIKAQAKRYDADADLDPATEEILWSILDVLQTAGQQARRE